jgi:VIT1/CCC1 family predicted Fe2+/Mn2+ transporter
MEIYNNWWEEKRSAYLYTIMAECEHNILHKKLFNDLKEAAEKQADLWSEKIKASPTAFTSLSHTSFPLFVPDKRTRLVAWLVKCFGTENMHSILSAMKIRGMAIFTRYHNEHKHTGLNSASNLRAAIFGINDGLVSNMSLILGIAGASANPHFILLAGTAGLLAGACSMGSGEYISVRSQREVFEYQIAIEKQELEEYPEEETEELRLIYEARGVPKDQAHTLAKLMIDNPETGLNTLAREELGLNPDDLVSPLGAALSSFLAFSIGAGIPLLPFILWHSSWNLILSMSLTGIMLFIVGSILSLFTNRNPIILGFRMLLIGGCAGGFTFIIGRLLGIAT